MLCGSRKYPIKEPFVELIKGSLNTFLNAMTYPDRTCYPVASCNLQDFKNLVDVYLDAVFHPRCMTNEKTFLQEGWHYELDSPEGEMTFKGVVFNEMKGVYSSPDSVLAREAQQALFPDNTYGVDSGGDPRVIPDLSFDEFKAFHGKFYHPSNARLWFYGDDDVEDRLELLDSFLNEFEREEVDSAVATQPFFAEPKRVVASYVAGEGEEQQKSFVQVNWLLNDGPFDQETALAVGFLDNLLMGSPAAPLRMALEESGLGEAIVGWGLEDELRQPTFAIGLKGVAKEDIPKVEKLIEDTIAAIAKDGFTQAAIDASVNTIEFSMRENNTGRFPRGLSLMLRSLSAWLYDGDPVMPLRFEEPLAQLKKRMAEGDVFRPLIQKLLIDNTHQVTVELNPDKAMAKAQDDEEKARIAAHRAGLSPRRSRRWSRRRRSSSGCRRRRTPRRRSRASPRSWCPTSQRKPSPSPRTSARSAPPSCSRTTSPPPRFCTPSISWYALRATRGACGFWIFPTLRHSLSARHTPGDVPTATTALHTTPRAGLTEKWAIARRHISQCEKTHRRRYNAARGAFHSAPVSLRRHIRFASSFGSRPTLGACHRAKRSRPFDFR